MSEREMVFVARRTGGSMRSCYHTDPDCERLSRARSVVEKPLNLLPDHLRHCEFCSGEFEHTGSSDPNAIRRTLLETDPEDLGLSPSGEVRS